MLRLCCTVTPTVRSEQQQVNSSDCFEGGAIHLREHYGASQLCMFAAGCQSITVLRLVDICVITTHLLEQRPLMPQAAAASCTMVAGGTQATAQGGCCMLLVGHGTVLCMYGSHWSDPLICNSHLACCSKNMMHCRELGMTFPTGVVAGRAVNSMNWNVQAGLASTSTCTSCLQLSELQALYEASDYV